MSQQTAEIERIIAKSIVEELTKEEQHRLNDWLSQSQENELLYRMFKEEYMHGEMEQINKIDNNSGWQILANKMDKGICIVSPEKHSYRRLFASMAASILLLVGIGAVAWYYLSTGSGTMVTTRHEAPIPPGRNKATLTLADGAQILLDTAALGSIALQGHTSIIHQPGQLAYRQTYETHQPIWNNKLSTPVGGQYSLVLPDGSRVWLNAQSAISFPAAFPKSERVVELIGEAYFQVVHNSASPFKVFTQNGAEKMMIKVLGTSFTVSSYPGQLVTSTLLQGAVQVHTGGTSKKLIAGQAASVANGKISIVPADTAKAAAWKNGDFSFSNDSIQTIMSQLARWYNIQVRYVGDHTGLYTGTISRNNNLQEVLQMLHHSGLEFRLQGRSIIIYQ